MRMHFFTIFYIKGKRKLYVTTVNYSSANSFWQFSLELIFFHVSYEEIVKLCTKTKFINKIHEKISLENDLCLLKPMKQHTERFLLKCSDLFWNENRVLFS